jgi:hypothetical protein
MLFYPYRRRHKGFAWYPSEIEKALGLWMEVVIDEKSAGAAGARSSSCQYFIDKKYLSVSVSPAAISNQKKSGLSL